MKISYDAFYLFILHLFYLPECCIFDLNISHSQPCMILYSNEYTYINLLNFYTQYINVLRYKSYVFLRLGCISKG